MSFTQPHVVPNPQDSRSSSKHKHKDINNETRDISVSPLKIHKQKKKVKSLKVGYIIYMNWAVYSKSLEETKAEVI